MPPWLHCTGEWLARWCNCPSRQASHWPTQPRQRELKCMAARKHYLCTHHPPNGATSSIIFLDGPCHTDCMTKVCAPGERVPGGGYPNQGHVESSHTSLVAYAWDRSLVPFSNLRYLSSRNRTVNVGKTPSTRFAQQPTTYVSCQRAQLHHPRRRHRRRLALWSVVASPRLGHHHHPSRQRPSLDPELTFAG